MSGDGVQLPAIDPTVRRLEDDCLRLRAELADLLAERDEWQHVVRPNVEIEYLQKLGAPEHHLLSLQIELRRWRRAIALAQAAINRGEPVSQPAIERRLDAELATWYEQLADADRKLLQAVAGLTEYLSESEAAELKRLYRKLALKLHPDVTGLDDPTARNLWNRVVEAYAAANLAELRALWLVAEELPATLPLPDTIELLTARKQQLVQAVKQVVDGIAALRSRPPLNLMEQLADTAWVERRLAELAAQIESAMARRDELRQTALAMMGVVDHDRRDQPH